jgi:hypothetical protein
VAAYLTLHPPARRQFYETRLKAVTAIGLHTAENTPDLVLPDAGAEGVARYISTRSTAGSYASVVDSDSTVRVCEYWWTAFHMVGFNSRSLGLSFATRAAQWDSLPQSWRDGAIAQGAAEAARMCKWVLDEYGWVIPPKLLTKAQAQAGRRGFVAHAIIDPARRSDPGMRFPWAQFAALYVQECNVLGIDPGPIDLFNPMTGKSEPGGSTVSSDYETKVGDAAERLQRIVLSHGANLGKTGPAGDGVDRDPGPATLNAASTVIELLQRKVSELSAQVGTMTTAAAEQGIEIDRLRAQLAAASERPDEVPEDILAKAALADRIVAGEAAKLQAVNTVLGIIVPPES